MIRGELWAWLALVVAVNSAAWAFSTPVHAPPSLLAAAAPAAQCESKTAVDNFSSECRKGCEYTITPNIKKENTVDIKARVIDATGIQPGTVKYKDDRGDTMIRVCDESIEKSLGPDLPKLKSRWIKSEEGYGADYGSSAYVDTYGSLADTGDAVYLPNSSALGEAYTLADKAEANTPAAGITQDAEQQIQDAARAAIDTDPRIESAAYQLQACASTGKCYEPQYIGADDGPSVAEYWKNNVARSAVREDTSGAIASAYPDSAGYITTQRPGTTNVWSVTEYEKWYDNDTGEVFMSRDNGQSDPVIYGKDGIPMQTSPQYGLWAVNLPSLDTPEKFGEFEKTYFDGGTTPGAFIKTDGNMVMASEAYSPYIVKEVSRDAYDAIRQQGDVANGVPGIINRTSAITSGRVLFDAPNTFPR
ncbi:MAG: hypothetical protein U1D26_01405, partial [Patescibacteria group bacterium]|nr:hypothetical protein [Patescibacteria group bacterium]